MLPRILLDEMVSPTLVSRCWELGMDTVSLRDRGLLGASDSAVWALAQAEERAIVTINEADFRPLAEKATQHHGLLFIPTGGTRDQQFDYIAAIYKRIDLATKPFYNLILSVSVTLNVVREVSLPFKPDLPHPKPLTT